MAYADAIKSAMMNPPASIGSGTPPDLPGVPPPPTGVGKISTGAPGKPKMAIGGAAISSLRDLQGTVPERFGQINEWISQIKQWTMAKPGDSPGPAVDKPGLPGPAQTGASPLMDSGSPGSM